MTLTVEFRDDDAGYLAWLTAHPEGYVINIRRSYNPTDACVHEASCRTISGQSIPGKALTKAYVKRCAEHLGELENWAVTTVDREIQPCRTCRPTSRITERPVTVHGDIAVEGGSGVRVVGDAVTVPVSGRAQPVESLDAEDQGHFTIRGPTLHSHVVEAWSSSYIFDGRRPVWLENLRSDIRSRCSQLTPVPDQVLHAMYFGVKRPDADVENLLFYNVGTFRVAGGNGIRFEHGVGVPAAPDGTVYPYAYRYALAHRDGDFQDWRPGRELASFGWVDIGVPNKNPTLAQTWLALSRNPGRTSELPRTPGMPFALRIEIRRPQGQDRVWGGLVKSIFDGAICAYQAHTDQAVLPTVAERIAAALGEDAQEVAALLLDQRHAMLGVVPQLVKPYGKSWETTSSGAGVQWHPSDEMCVAGELLPDATEEHRLGKATHWAIKGQLIELIRSQ